MKLVVLTPGSLHAGFVGCYGNEWIATPNLDRLASEGATFDQHYADVPTKDAAVRAWRTGCYRFANQRKQPGPTIEEQPDLLALLRSADVHTTLFTAHDLSAWSMGWAQVEVAGSKTSRKALPWQRMARSLPKVLDHLENHQNWLLWLDASIFPSLGPDGPQSRNLKAAAPADASTDECVESNAFPGELETSDFPLTPEDEEVLRNQDRYAEAVERFDEAVGALRTAFLHRDVKDVALLVTTDSGFGIGERSGSSDPTFLHEERIHLPLILRLPNGALAGQRVSAFTQSIDVMPTILELFGVAKPSVHGGSILGFCFGEPEPIRPYVVCQSPDGSEWMIRSTERALLLDSAEAQPEPSARLFVKPDDRWEVNDIAGHYPGLVHAWRRTLSEFLIESQKPGPLTCPALTSANDAVALMEEINHADG